MTRTQDYLLITAGIALLLILSAPWAEARTYADRTLNWECPTTRTDGSPFACATDASGYDLEVTTTNGNAPVITELPANVTTKLINADPSGTLYRLRVCDLAGQCSEWSASARKPANPKRVVVSVQ